MYTDADLQALVPTEIFDRGAAYYYEDEAVVRLTQKGSTYRANVRGTETYRVALTVQPSGLPESYCDCPYEHGEVCKHDIALGLSVRDLPGPNKPVQLPAPPCAPADQEQPTSQQFRQALAAAFTRTH